VKKEMDWRRVQSSRNPRKPFYTTLLVKTQIVENRTIDEHVRRIRQDSSQIQLNCNSLNFAWTNLDILRIDLWYMVRTSNRGSSLGVLWNARRRIVRLAAIALVCLVAATASSDKSSRIIGGKPADPNTYQEFVSLTYRFPRDGYEQDSYPHACGGTLIRKSVVLTAAHCLFEPETGEPYDVSRFVVVKGQLDYLIDPPIIIEMKGKHSSRVKKVVPHPDYRFDPENASGSDIALIFLENPLPGPFAKLPSGAVTGKVSVGDKATIVGFGVNNNYIDEFDDGSQAWYPPVLYEVDMTVAELGGEDCDEVELTGNPDALICYVGAAFSLNQEALGINGNQAYADQGGEFYKTDCIGDSGGPSFNQYGVQIGIVSYGQSEPDCDKTFNSKNVVHTKVRSYLGWIRRTIRRTILSQILDELVSW
jgi:secreted trypsin-like serine protease